MDKAHNAIILSLSDEVMREVGDQATTTSLWKKWEDLYTKVYYYEVEYKENVIHPPDGIRQFISCSY